MTAKEKIAHIGATASNVRKILYVIEGSLCPIVSTRQAEPQNGCKGFGLPSSWIGFVCAEDRCLIRAGFPSGALKPEMRRRPPYAIFLPASGPGDWSNISSTVIFATYLGSGRSFGAFLISSRTLSKRGPESTSSAFPLN